MDTGRPVYLTTDPKGSPFCETKWDTGNIIVGIATWSSNWDRIYRIELRYEDGTTKAYGSDHTEAYHPNGSRTPLNVAKSGSLGLQPGEVITKLKMAAYLLPYKTGPIEGLSTMYIETSGKQKADFGQSSGLTQREAEIPINRSGILIGISGTADADGLYSLKFHFMPSPIKKITVSNVTYDDDIERDGPPLRPLQAGSHVFCNAIPGSNGSFDYTAAMGHSGSYEVKNETITKFGTSFKAEISAGLPFLSKAEAGASWEKSESSSTALTGGSSNMMTGKQIGTLAPMTAVQCTNHMVESNGTFPYHSLVTLRLEDKTNHTYPQAGSIFVSEVRAWTVCEPMDFNTARAHKEVKYVGE